SALLVLLCGCNIGDTETQTQAKSLTSPTSTVEPPTFTPAITETPTLTPIPPTSTPTRVPSPTATITPAPPPANSPVVVNGRAYDAYVPAATKKHQVYHYSCEFDAAWVVLETYGFDVSLDEQLAIVGVDDSIEPYFKETAKGFIVYGGDIIDHYSG